MNTATDFKKYDYNRRDPRQNYQYVRTTHYNTLIVIRLIENLEQGGGPLTTAIQSPLTASIPTPSIQNIIKYQNKQTLGYFSIKNMLDKPAGEIFTFYDIDLLLLPSPDWSDAESEKAVEVLQKMS